MEDMGNRLKRARKAKKLTQCELATMLGVEQSAISNYETNFRVPTASVIALIASVLDVSTDYLIGYNHPKEMVIQTINIKESQESFLHALFAGEEKEAEDILSNYLQSGMTLLEIFTDLIEPTLQTIGERWSAGDMNIAHEHMITAIIDRMIGSLDNTIQNISQMAGAVGFILPGSEEHELGLKMAAILFKQYGWKTFYFGRSLPVTSLNAFLQSNPITYLVMTVTIRTHLNSCETLIQAIKSYPESYQPKILLSGAAIMNESHAKELLQADEYVGTFKDLDIWLQKKSWELVSDTNSTILT